LLGTRFFLRRDLIYFRDDLDGRERLCIPKNMFGDIFKMAHDDHYYSGFERTYARVSASFVIRSLLRYLRKYIEHC
jgi:hypothetical protein